MDSKLIRKEAIPVYYALRTIISESRLLNDRLGNFERGSNSRIRIVCKA